MNAISQLAALADPFTFAISRADSFAVIEATSLPDLVKFGRLFLAYNVGRPGYTAETAEQMDQETDVLNTIDDEITALIIARQPKDAAEYGLKSAYLFARIRCDNMSDASIEKALGALERDGRAMAGLPFLITAQQGDD